MHTKELDRLGEFFEILEEFAPVLRPVALPQREQGPYGELRRELFAPSILRRGRCRSFL